MEKVNEFVAEKMYRENDGEIVCRKCEKITIIGFNLPFQTPEYEKFVGKMRETSLCPDCLKSIEKTLNDLMSGRDEIILEKTTENMFAVGVL